MNTHPWLSGLLNYCTQSKMIRPVGHFVLVAYYRFLYSAPYKIAYLKARLRQKDTFTILFYPVCPSSLYVLQLLRSLFLLSIFHLKINTCSEKI